MLLDMDHPRWGIIGYGEVGSALARHLSDPGGAEVRVTAPSLTRPDATAPQSGGPGLKISRDVRALVQDSDVVLSAVSPKAAGRVARTVAATRPDVLFIDLNSTSPREKGRAAGNFSGSFVDGAILGSFAGRGTEVPIALSGPRSGEADSLLSTTGLRTSVVGPEVGAAAALKMCRSVFMKGLECLFIEAYLAGARFNLSEALKETIEQTFSTYTIREFSTMLLTTHALHADRRAHEMTDVVETLRESGLPSPMSAASRSLLEESVRAGLEEAFGYRIPDDPEEVIQALSRHYGSDPEV